MLDELFKAVGVKDLTNISEPIINMVGNHLVIVTNSMGIMDLSDSLVCVKADKTKKIIIEGEFLECMMLNKSEVQVKGRILDVRWEKL